MKINQTVKKVKSLPKGQILKSTIGRSMILIRPLESGYEVEVMKPLRSIFSEDPLSIRCGCHLEGRSHGHAKKKYDTVEEAVEVYNEEKRNLKRRKSTKFAKIKRIG